MSNCNLQRHLTQVWNSSGLYVQVVMHTFDKATTCTYVLLGRLKFDIPRVPNFALEAHIRSEESNITPYRYLISKHIAAS
uniref:DUF223 domain-containing protein n=1 Tax=Steinernema glaseri TaxID=37863 RepID=A0A1I7YEI5_9BILA